MTTDYPKAKSKFAARFLKDVADTELQRSGEISKGLAEKNVRVYEPTVAEKAILERVQRAYNVGEYNLNKPIKAYSNRSVIEMNERAHEILHIYKPEIQKAIEEAWQSDVRRPISRNKVVAVVAHQLHKLIVPSVKAQTEDNRHDEVAAQAMRDLLDFVRYQCGYKHEMMYALIEATASPVLVVEAGYRTLHKQKKSKNEAGEWKAEMVVDSLLSGFYMQRHDVVEFLVPSLREKNIQMQEWVIKRRIISEDMARAKYGTRDNYSFVVPGVYYKLSSTGSIYLDASDGMITQGDIKWVEEVVFLSRHTDTKAVLLNGVLVTDPDEGIGRPDGRYQYARLVYEPVTNSETEFYGYPFILKLMEDQDLVERLYNVTMDGAILDAMPPVAVSESVSRANAVPGASVVVREDFKATPLGGGRNVSSGLSAINQVERSFDVASPDHQVGVGSPGEKTRREVELLDANASTGQALFKAGIEQFVIELTDIFIGDIQEYITRSQVEKLVHNVFELDTIIIPESMHGGTPTTRALEFVSPLANAADDEKRAYDIYDREQKTGATITELNPVKFLDVLFSAYVQPEQSAAQDPQRREIVARELYILMKDNPTVSLEDLTRYVFQVYTPYTVDKLMKNPAALKALQQQLQQSVPGSNQQRMTRTGGADNLPAGGVDIPNPPVV